MKPEICDWCKEVCNCAPDIYTGELPTCCLRIGAHQTFIDADGRRRDFNDNRVSWSAGLAARRLGG